MNKKQIFAMIMPLAILVAIPGLLLFYYQNSGLVPGNSRPLVFAGALLCLVGIAIMGETVNALHKIGEGTITPWNPTVNLVTSGLYGYSRNPMIGGAILILLGEALIFESAAIAIYLFAVFIVNSLYFQYVEEPNLEKRFGQKYQDYKKNVPMWVPRKNPWNDNSIKK